MTISQADRTRHTTMRAGEPASAEDRKPRSRSAEPQRALSVNRDEQLRLLLDHFMLSVEQAARLLDCTVNTIYNRRSRVAPVRHTKLDDKIDAVFFAFAAIEDFGLPPTTVRDWIFARSRYFDGLLPAEQIARGHTKLVIEAARAYMADLSPRDFRERLAELAERDGGGPASGGTVHPLPQIA